MGVYSANWEDEESNRIIELAVEYRLDGEETVLVDITPISVTFVEAESQVPTRTIKIWTDTARRLLMRAVHERGGLEWVESQISPACSVA